MSVVWRKGVAVFFVAGQELAPSHDLRVSRKLAPPPRLPAGIHMRHHHQRRGIPLTEHARGLPENRERQRLVARPYMCRPPCRDRRDEMRLAKLNEDEL